MDEIIWSIKIFLLLAFTIAAHFLPLTYVDMFLLHGHRAGDRNAVFYLSFIEER